MKKGARGKYRKKGGGSIYTEFARMTSCYDKRKKSTEEWVSDQKKKVRRGNERMNPDSSAEGGCRPHKKQEKIGLTAGGVRGVRRIKNTDQE